MHTKAPEGDKEGKIREPHEQIQHWQSVYGISVAYIMHKRDQTSLLVIRVKLMTAIEQITNPSKNKFKTEGLWH